MKKLLWKMAVAFVVVTGCYLAVTFISIIQETNRDSKIVTVPFNEGADIFHTDVSDMDDVQIHKLMLGQDWEVEDETNNINKSGEEEESQEGLESSQ